MKWIQLLKGTKSAPWICAAALLGVILLIAGRMQKETSAGDGQTPQETVSVSSYTDALEERIEALCMQIDGIREAHVLLTLDGGSEYVYAENTRVGAADYLLMQRGDSEEPVLVREIYPSIRGVAIVCTHGGDSAVQRLVTELLSAALGIPASRIRVAGC